MMSTIEKKLEKEADIIINRILSSIKRSIGQIMFSAKGTVKSKIVAYGTNYEAAGIEPRHPLTAELYKLIGATFNPHGLFTTAGIYFQFMIGNIQIDVDRKIDGPKLKYTLRIVTDSTVSELEEGIVEPNTKYAQIFKELYKSGRIPHTPEAREVMSMLESGTRKTVKRPFVGNAVNEVAPEVEKKVRDAIKRELSKFL